MAGGTFTILVADDEAAIRDFLVSVLEPQGYRVLIAARGDEAISLALREAPEVVLLDVNMPGADGYEVTRALRADAATRRTAIIMLTGEAGEDRAARGFALGADDFLVKPLRPANVLARVQTWLLRHAERASAPIDD
jgi:DNA-binding response OmpR family regulator